LQKRPILRFSSGGMDCSQRQSRTSGWISDRAELLDRVLGGLGLHLPGGLDERQQGEVNETGVAARQFLTKLADGLEERQPLDVADGAADLHQDEVDVPGSARTKRLISSVTWGITCTVAPR